MRTNNTKDEYSGESIMRTDNCQCNKLHPHQGFHIECECCAGMCHHATYNKSERTNKSARHAK